MSLVWILMAAAVAYASANQQGESSQAELMGTLHMEAKSEAALESRVKALTADLLGSEAAQQQLRVEAPAAARRTRRSLNPIGNNCLYICVPCSNRQVPGIGDANSCCVGHCDRLPGSNWLVYAP